MAATPRLYIAIGVSAGGIDPLREFFAAMPADCAMTFIVVSHQTSGDRQLLDFLERHVAMPVSAIADQTKLQPGHVYVVDCHGAHFANGTLQRADEPNDPRFHLPIDALFCELAEGAGRRVVGIVLSGNGSDGTLGLSAIRRARGLTIAQEPRTARFFRMPASAIASGEADRVLTPAQMPAAILDYAEALTHDPETDAEPPFDESFLSKVLHFIRTRVGHDFSAYKRGTLTRRIRRRMSVRLVEKSAAYLELLQAMPSEVDALYRELLVGVTSFFRDPLAFDALKRQVLPALLARTPVKSQLRIWIPGCATGEEAYSIAMLLREVMEEHQLHREVQIFATDLDDRAIAVARTAAYPLSISADVNEARLQRFFILDGDQYQVSKQVRRMVIFAPQNLITDPPFTRMDLISCRNLLIYFDGKLQQQVLPTLHYALKPDGVLFIGTAESLGACAERFDTIDRQWNIYRRREVQMPNTIAARVSRATPVRTSEATVGCVEPSLAAEGSTQLLLDMLVPPSLIVDAQGDILHVHGRAATFLDAPPSEPNTNVLRLAREGLRFELLRALHEAMSTAEPVFRHGLQVCISEQQLLVNLRVQHTPLPPPDGAFVISFETQSIVPRTGVQGDPQVSQPVEPGAAIERELASLSDALRRTAERHETMHDQLSTNNEELTALNEELRSRNDELGAARQDQQSLIEELQAVNSELRGKVHELSTTQDELRNLWSGTDIAILLLDSQLCIKRFNREATRIVNLIAGDIGRPLAHLHSKLTDENLDKAARAVLQTQLPMKREVQAQDSRRYQMCVSPFCGDREAAAGVLMTFVELTGP